MKFGRNMMKGGMCNMKKINVLFVTMFLLVGTLGFVAAAGTGSGGSDSEPVASGSGQGSTDGDGAQIANAGEGQKIQLQVGEHVGVDGQRMMIRQEAGNQMKLEVGGKSATSLMKMNQEMVNGQTKLSTQLSNGRSAEVKVMPDKASEAAMNKLQMKNCAAENGCSIELKEVGQGDEAKLAYEVKTQKQSRVFGLFKVNMQVQAQVNAENGEVLESDKPWWAFLASESEE